MSNKISGFSPPDAATIAGSGGGPAADKVPVGAATAVATATPAGSTATGSPATAADSATITGPARTLQKLSEVIAKTPVVNAEKVSAIKSAVQNGSYRVNAGAVADKLLQHDSELG